MSESKKEAKPDGKKKSDVVKLAKGKVEDLVLLAKVAEKADRYEDMCELLSEVVKKKKGKLDAEERNILSVAYKNVVGTKRASWRTLNQQDTTDDNKTYVEKFKSTVENELTDKCDEILKLLDDHLVAASKDEDDQEVHIFYLKMKGDYFRYLAEILPKVGETTDKEGKKIGKYPLAAKDAYNAAMKVADEKLDVTNPTRLGLALNFSVCHYEILNSKQQACALAKKAFDDAISKLDMLNDNNYKDSTLIMQLLRDNLTLWTSEESNNQEEEQED